MVYDVSHRSHQIGGGASKLILNESLAKIIRQAFLFIFCQPGK
jgi:hypothetical protein